MAVRYHHGDLRQALLDAAALQLAEQGIEQLTLRKLADKVGVSRTGAYHHFASKNDLVCAVAAQGFGQLQQMIEQAATKSGTGVGAEMQHFVFEYVDFATTQPELYELMFGRKIWKVEGATAELKAVAYACFARYNKWTERTILSVQPGVPKLRCLRIAQANWAAIHGLCRLSIDGIYMESADLSGVVGEVVEGIARRIQG